MIDKLIKLKLTNEKNCFLSIPRCWREETQHRSWFYFELINVNNSTKVYLEWSGNCVSNDDYIELSAIFANKLGFQNDQLVLVNIIEKEVKKANEIIIQPNSEFDWENFKLYSNEIEMNLLNQIKIVWPNLVFPVWPRPEICIYLKIHFKDSSHQLLRLETFTELIGITDERDIKKVQQESDDQNGNRENLNNSSTTVEQPESTFASLFKYLPNLKLNQTKPQVNLPESTSDSFLLPTLNTDAHILNAINFRSNQINLNKLNTIYVNSLRFNAKNKDRSIGKLVRLLSPQETNNRKETLNKKNADKSKTDLIEENQYLETIVEINFIDECPLDSFIACDSLVLQLDLCPFSKIILSSVGQDESLNDLQYQMTQLDQTNLIKAQVVNNLSFSIHQNIPNLDQISSSITQFIKNYCSEHSFLILNKSTLIKYLKYEFVFQPEFSQKDYVVLTEQSVLSNSLEIRILNQIKERLKTSWNCELPRTNLDHVRNKMNQAASDLPSNGHVYEFKNYELLFKRCKKMINQCFASDTNTIKNRIVLIHGKKGSGKTTMVTSLVNDFHQKQKNCNMVHLDCAKLKGKKLDLLKKTLLNIINESIYSQPCLLVIENIHILLPKPANLEQEHKLDLLYNERVKLILIELIDKYLKETVFVYGQKLFTIITSRSDNLFQNQNLELDIFDEILELKPPSIDCNIKLINYLIKSKLKDYQVNYDQVDFNHLENTIRNELIDCVPLDLSIISERIINNIILDNKSNLKSKSPLIVKPENYLNTINNYIPLNLRSVKSKNKFKNKKLDDLGGLSEVKERLKQIIYWPIKYPKLFQNYPIDPQTCVLLYGIPGTGKTCLAQALANEFKINFISIKGPEILSKYIGASEQAIRELFEKASLSKPCLVFFDEFDSIVPPRQNNNTDVTDRLVNQILTQMDGIESLQEGIYIIAATSRPDMIDPALLRPGRFDVCLECNLPSRDERFEILKLLSKQVSLDESVDLDLIASRTTNFTGSDLNTLIINATNQAVNELISLDDKLEVQNDDNLKQSLIELKLSLSHFESALQATSPSFNDKEILEYNKIFSKLKSDDAFDKKEVNLEAKSIFAT